MENGFGAVLLENIEQEVFLANDPNLNAHIDVVVPAHILVLEQVRIVFSHVEDNNTLRCHRRHPTVAPKRLNPRRR